MTTLVCAACGRDDSAVEAGWHRTRRADDSLGELRCGACSNGSTRSASGRVATFVRREDDDHAARTWGHADGGTPYRIVERQYVSLDVRRAVNLAKTFVAAHLGLEDAAVTFFLPESVAEATYREVYGYRDWPSFRHPDCAGLSNSLAYTIAVRADVSPADAVEIACHELRHLAQPLKGMSKPDREADATAYAEWAASALVRRRGNFTDLAPKVHVMVGEPHAKLALASDAAVDDVLIASSLSGRIVYRNVGWNGQPDWVRHEPRCPVALRVAA